MKEKLIEYTRYQVQFLLLLFLSLSMTSLCFGAMQNPGQDVLSCKQNELSIVGKGENQSNFRYRLNEVLKIQVSGNCFGYIRSVLEENNSTENPLVLYLDDVKMDSLSVVPERLHNDSQKADTFTMVLAVQLKRTSSNPKSKQNWDAFLDRQSSGYLMTPTVALSVNGGIPFVVTLPESPKPDQSEFQFYVAEKKWVGVAASVGILVFFGSFYLLVKNPTALRDNKSELYSLGKSQMAFWGLLVIISFFCIWCLTGTVEQIPDQILMLMGLSGATALSSVVIGENKKAASIADKKKDLDALKNTERDLKSMIASTSEETRQGLEERLLFVSKKINQLLKTSLPAKSRGFFQDICDGGNGMSFHRLQAVLWTIILGIIFVVSINDKISMPEFPDNLLLLLGVSNLTYIGFKFPDEKQDKV